MSSVLDDTAVRQFTVEEYYRMAEVGLLSPEERVELIEGIICKMSPEGNRHVVAIDLVLDLLKDRLQGRHHVRAQHPITVSDVSEPVPDIAVVEASDPRAYLADHPRTALLVIEVAESSLRKDLKVKPRSYAKAGVPEYWVVNLVEETLEVFRDPSGSDYRTRFTVRRGERVRMVAVPDVEIEVNEILP